MSSALDTLYLIGAVVLVVGAIFGFVVLWLGVVMAADLRKDDES